MAKEPVARKKSAKSIIKANGPINNLEEYLKSDWWKRIFNSMYIKTDADVVEDELITSSEVDLICDIVKLKNGSNVLDLACGQGRHLIELGQRGTFNLFGIDRSRYLIQRGKNTAKKKGISINFKEGDARKLPYLTDTFDLVTILGNSFGYFNSIDDDIKILKEVFRVLKPNGLLLMDIADGEFLKTNFTPRSWEWIDKKHFVCRERSMAADNERLISREVITHTEKGVLVDQFYAERLYSKEDLMSLLDKVGFSNVRFNGQLVTDSMRNQDLGMMEKRFILTSEVKKEWTPKKLKKELINVAVLLGDPRIGDVIKPDAKFDADDFETIDKLKIALSKSNKYKFSYISNHQSLISDLQKIKGNVELIFNLCDEGFNNEATKELHIPALLEMMNFKYTGSNPQTLAYCYDKSLIRGISTEIGVTVADGFVITSDENLFELNIPFPVIAKPNFGDSSFGINQDNVAYDIEQLTNAIQRIRTQFGYNKPILVEEFLTGPELSFGVIGNLSNYTLLPIIEEDYSELPKELPKICGYEAKWLVDSPYMRSLRSIRADIPIETEQVIIDSSLKLFERLQCMDYCRFDWRLSEKGIPKLLEVNPNPGWCWDGHLAKMAAFADIDYPAMLELILDAAMQRYERN
ncbi:MAG TPA: methyltransferase domain-containing protein [Saprospiraceae bacterium]|nr:methyltransferase domain-containing protein [Saprospiraceae bacterium]